MASPESKPVATETQLPPWETPNPRTNNPRLPSFSGYLQNIRAKGLRHFDRKLPPGRQYFGLSRKTFCVSIFVVMFLLLLAIILGLSIGLSTGNSNHHKQLPLNSESHTGDLTYYTPAVGACGIKSTEEDMIVSISHYTFDAVSKSSDPNANPLCRHKIRAVREGKSVDLMVVDRCTGCQPTDIDVSPGAFKILANPALGRTTVTWAWLPPVPTT